MRDIVHTLRAVRGHDPAAVRLQMVRVVLGLGAIANGRTKRLSVLLSDDDESKIVDFLARPGRAPHRVRLWWNTSEDIAAFLKGGAGLGETHVCFFRDGWASLAPPLGTLIVAVPYAFTTPVRDPKPAAPSGIWYAAEVDISDDCLAGVVTSSSTASLSARVWDLARAVVAGETTLVDADPLLEGASHDRPDVYRTALWALRNRVRYLLVDGLVAAFPGRVQLRGSDWLKLGFDAQPTKFRRWRRLSEHERCRVALDLGSKSTHSWLYPRTADILAAGGGLVQFDSGQADLDLLPGMQQRRARTLSDLVGAVDRVLTLPSADVTAENRGLHEGYRALRLDAGGQLTAAVVQEME
jgi:hypothetical protein